MSLVVNLTPSDAATAAAMLAEAVKTHTLVYPEGHGTKRSGVGLERARPISTGLLTQGLIHYAGDLVATVPAGLTLADANAALARERQWIPLDPRFPETATIGGIVATNDSGPRRHRYGTPRDLVIGIEVALASGHVARAGGRVVKNVAGYDLSRLFCGSYGSLGLITQATFKLAPIAPASRTVVARFQGLPGAVDAALRLAATAALTPSALEVAGPDARLLVRFESTERSAAHMAAAAQMLVTDAAEEVAIVAGRDEQAVWAAHQLIESDETGVLMRVCVLPTQATTALYEIAKLAERFGLSWSIAGRAGLGLLAARVLGDTASQVSFTVALRTALAASGGHVTLLAGPDSVLAAAGAFGATQSSTTIAAAVKERFDPAHILPYPWSRA